MVKTFSYSTQFYQWQYQGRDFRIAYDVRGEGSPVLLLPAFSTVSTREEMLGIAEVLASDFQVVTLDWLGFGESDRPNLNYARSLYEELAKDFIQSQFEQPISVIAAGHAAGYAMQVAHRFPSLCSKMVLIAPTWKGPLRAMGLPSPVAAGIKNLVRSPGLGQTLYALNTTPQFLEFMYRRHVYTNPERLTPEFMAQKHEITQKSGARHAPAAFVTGALDPMSNHEEFLNVARSLNIPMKIIIGEDSPPKSKAEMESLKGLPNIETVHLPGSLGMHEEYASPLGKTAKLFLSQ